MKALYIKDQLLVSIDEGGVSIGGDSKNFAEPWTTLNRKQVEQLHEWLEGWLREQK